MEEIENKPQLNNNGFTVSLTPATLDLPDVDYINGLSVEKGFSLSKSFDVIPAILYDLFYLFTKEADDPTTFNVNKHLLTKRVIADKVIFRELTQSESSYYNNTLKFLKSIDYMAIVGLTPMDKALRTMMYLVMLSKATNKTDDPYGRQSSVQEDITIPDEQALADALKEQADGIRAAEKGGSQGQGGDQGKQSEPSELNPNMTSCVRDALYGLSPVIANIIGDKKPVDVPVNKALVRAIKVKAYLEDSVGLETALDVTKKRNNQSNERKQIQMESSDQITKIRKSEMLKPTFEEKFVKKELVVKEKVKPEEKKQILYMLLDDSGSMGNITKQSYVRAVLLNRLESVMLGKSELRFYLYESNLHHYKVANDKKSAQELYQFIAKRRPHGGGTYIGNCLQRTVDEIKKAEAKGNYHDPEIMIVCDGDDYVNPSELDAKDVRINVLLLGTQNPGLKKIAKKTDGFYKVEEFYNRY